MTSHYADNTKDYPIDIENYYKDELFANESKILACLAIEKAVKNHQIKANWCSFDSWYGCKKVIDKVELLDLFFVSQLKSNRLAVYQDQQMKVSDFVTVASASSADVASSIIDGGEVYISKLGYYRLLIKNNKCFITNNFDLEPEAVISHYQHRWAIDDFYKQAKDNISFSQFQVRKGLSVLRHWILVFLAHTFYLHCKLKGVLSKIYQGTIKTLSEFTKVIQNLNLVRVSQDSPNVLMAKFGFRTLN